jgi:hypothetical protein
MLPEDNNKPAFIELDSLELRDVIAQAEKDMALSGLSYSFKAENAPKLIKEMARYLAELTGSELSNLLYRVDINPRHLESAEVDHLALAIWNRIFKKVWFRKSFKTGNK